MINYPELVFFRVMHSAEGGQKIELQISVIAQKRQGCKYGFFLNGNAKHVGQYFMLLYGLTKLVYKFCND